MEKINMTLDEIKDICQKYSKIHMSALYGYGYDEKDFIDTCEKLKLLGKEWGDKITIANDFTMHKGYYLTNSAYKIKPDKNKWYIVWDNGNIGRLQFVNNIYWDQFGEEWAEFRNQLLAFNPVDYDPLNCTIVYDIENGKKVMAAYPEIVAETKKKAQKVMAKEKLKLLQKEMEELKKVEAE